MRTIRPLAGVAPLLLCAAAAHAQLVAEGDLLVTDSIGNRLLRVRPGNGDVVEVTVPDSLATPGGVAWTPHRLYVTNLASGTIRSVDPSNGEVNAVPITNDETEGLSSPFGIDVDAFGNLYVHDSNPGRVVKLVPAGGDQFEAQPFDAAIPNFGRGLAITRNDAGEASDAYWGALPSDELWALDIATDTPGAIADTPVADGNTILGVASFGDCAQLACVIAFTEFTNSPTGECTNSKLSALVVVGIIAGVTTIYDLPGRCPYGVAIVSASEFYVATMVNANTGAGARMERIYDAGSAYVSELVASLEPVEGLLGVRPTDVAIVPEPGSALGAAIALAALRVVRRREAV